jgi:glycosyltransferase involved in cell wall biosynthesis
MEELNSSNNQISTKRPVVGFWAGDLNNFQFIDPIIERLRESFDVRKFQFDRNNLGALERDLRTCDLAWFDWANDAVVPASFNNSIKIPFICRLHRYEIYDNFPSAINWKHINKLVFVSGSIHDYFKSHYPDFYEATSVTIIKNGVDTKRFNGDMSRPRGKNICYAGRLHFIKNPTLLLQCFAAIAKKDPEFRFHVAGSFSEQIIAEYFWDQIEKLGLKESITYYGKINNIDRWLKDMDYMILTSIVEGGQPCLSILEAMATGVKPVIANYIGAEQVIPAKYLFNTVDECVSLVLNDDFNRSEYRAYVKTNNDFENQVAQIKALIESLLQSKELGASEKHIKNRDDWDILIPDSRFLSADDLNSFNRRLETSDAEILKVKVAYPIVEDHLVCRWEVAASSKTIESNKDEAVDCLAVCEEDIHLPYNEALESFMARDFASALNKFIQHYQNANSVADKTVYARWLALCLIELGRDQDALNVLSDSIQLVTDNSDLYYLHLMASLLCGRTEQIESAIENINKLGDAVNYPEFIYDIKNKVDMLINAVNNQQASA